MKLHDFIKRLLKRTSQQPPTQEQRRVRPTNHVSTMATMVLRAVEQTQDVELSCDDVHALLDQFAEMVYRGEDATQAMPMLQHHLEMCPDCREEFEALMRILKANPTV